MTLRGQDVLPGDLFAALPGATDARRPLRRATAIERGAVAVLTDAAGVAEMRSPRPKRCRSWCTRRRAACSASWPPRSTDGRPSGCAVIGITGTSGKTTTTYLVEAGLRAAGRVAGLIGTVGIRIDGVDVPSALTTPEAPALQALLAVMVERGVDTVVMEVSSHALTLGRVDGVALRGRRLHQPVPRPPRLPPHDGGLLRRQGAAVRPGVAVARAASRWCASTTSRAARWPPWPREPITVSTLSRRPAHWLCRGRRADGRGGQEFTAVDPAGVQHRCGSGCRAATTSPMPCSRWRFWTRSGCRRSRPRRDCAEPACPAGWSRSTAARTFSRSSTTRTSPARCGPC